MDDRPAVARPSGIPRPSRLPVPKPLRPAASHESLHDAAPARASTRDSLAMPPPRRPNVPSSNDQLRPARSRPSLRHAASASRLDQQEPLPKPDSRRTSSRPGALPDPIGSRRSSNMNRRTSGMYSTGGGAPVPSYATQPRRATPPNIEAEEPGTPDTRSLTERTIETLAKIQASPALSKRPSTFFDQERTPRTMSRASSESRPSRDGSVIRGSPSPHRFDLTPSRPLRPRASERSLGQQMRSPSAPVAQGPTSLPSPRAGELERSPSPTKMPAPPQPGLSPPGLAPQPLKLKPASNLVVAKKGSQGAAPAGAPRKVSRVANKPITPTKIAPPEPEEDGVSPSMEKARKSSAALREQIAKARAAAKKNVQKREVPVGEGGDEGEGEGEGKPAVAEGFDFGFEEPLHSDPFNQRREGDSMSKVLQQRAATGRTTGRLNIAALGLKEMPKEVMDMYDAEAVGAGNWAESVDLTKLVAADNEFEAIADEVFPDMDPEAMAEDEEGRGNIFGGLEMADLHGNQLVAVPLGLRQLKLLTSLNLSQNRLPNECLEVISQLPALRDLKLANNALEGPLPASVSELTNLEILDLHGNKLSELPDLGSLTRLRILNIGENRLEAIPFESLAGMPLTELVARSNKLTGTLIEADVNSLPNLLSLDVSSNQLTRIVPAGRAIALPAAQRLTLSLNRLQELPDVSTWTSLATLAADENAIAELPEGLTSLDRLRHVDLSNNDVRVVPPEVARMDGLVTLSLAGNPLRDKKFASISTEELKDILAARLEPPPPYHVGIAQTVDTFEEVKPAVEEQHEDDGRSSEFDHYATPPTSAPHSPARSRANTRSATPSAQLWPVKNGLLDRSSTDSSSLHPVVCARVAAEHRVTHAHLHHNLFPVLPEGLSFFAGTLTALSLAHNQLVGEGYLPEELELPALKELNLSSNRVSGLAPLTRNLRAPSLEKLDVSRNRISALPVPSLREFFPNLTVLLASDNQLANLDPEAIKGLRVVDAANNDVAHLDPRIGLLGGKGGLEKLEVGGNRFRVPRFSVIERGTEATLRWLRGRVPAEERGGGSESEDDVD